jgi:hypothetical protein
VSDNGKVFTTAGALARKNRRLGWHLSEGEVPTRASQHSTWSQADSGELSNVAEALERIADSLEDILRHMVGRPTKAEEEEQAEDAWNARLRLFFESVRTISGGKCPRGAYSKLYEAAEKYKAVWMRSTENGKTRDLHIYDFYFYPDIGGSSAFAKWWRRIERELEKDD